MSLTIMQGLCEFKFRKFPVMIVWDRGFLFAAKLSMCKFSPNFRSDENHEDEGHNGESYYYCVL